MDLDEIKQKKQEIIDRFGPWTLHAICLGGDVYTLDPYPESRLRQIVQIAADIMGKPFETLRVLDLACLEGQFGIEFALHGAQVVGIEGREVNLAKARFAKEVLALNNIDLVLDDVRYLSKDKYGEFDVVLALGILYHLDVPDSFHFVEKI